jgi:hypothetical protein
MACRRLPAGPQRGCKVSTHQDSSAKQTEGEAHKLEKTAHVRRHKLVATRRVQRGFVTRLMSTGQATTDDIRGSVNLPDACGTAVWGAAIQGLAKARLIRHRNYVTSSRPERHGCPIGSWELNVEHAEAEQWLRLHPDFPDPDEDNGEGVPSPSGSAPPSPSPLAISINQPTHLTTPSPSVAAAGLDSSMRLIP